ncbi:phenylacetic acid degradation operon negative regulatory protein [Kibdelosporangium banguiense]|uniref:Phenylacetic acid degradation operon negative regulatory protein n=1 Tax=Kibdelosporangium banguiense TaxID=1365924 RepID=A0ABS4TPJ9_9PSEU|nr:PaaX family transcriptional regulator C-terminal domain-containing protein [Kibdelosporangium banguiense]MBP2326327.1 phenylacetic acid degradation operon negative regulatory protein [Kibdelosporangium banguiense]
MTTAQDDHSAQSLMLSFLGIYLLDKDSAVYSGSVIDVFARVSVSEEAVRSTLTRMANRGLLTRHRQGRRVYFGLTDRAAQVLGDGARRVWRTGAVNRDWDGNWTMVAFSLPDSRRSDRHDLRSQLIWAGFGLLQNGLWIAPGIKDAAAIVEELGLAENVTVFTAQPSKPTESLDLIHKAFDTDAIAARYNEFLERWDNRTPLPSAPDDLARQLVLHTDWLQLVRQDPYLPAEHLTEDWPAIRAEKTFQELAAQYETTATAIATELIEEIRVER